MNNDYRDYRIRDRVLTPQGWGEITAGSDDVYTVMLDGGTLVTYHARELYTSTHRTYRIVRHYFRNGHRTIATGLSLKWAQAHCQNPETSSNTATSGAAKARTRRHGPWFDGYEEEK